MTLGYYDEILDQALPDHPRCETCVFWGFDHVPYPPEVQTRPCCKLPANPPWFWTDGNNIYTFARFGCIIHSERDPE